MVIPNMSALALSKAIQSKQVSCREVMLAFLNQIETHKPMADLLSLTNELLLHIFQVLFNIQLVQKTKEAAAANKK